jgi:hypothetical protein
MTTYVELLLVASLSIWIIVLCIRCAFVIQSLRGMGDQRQPAATNDNNYGN